MQKSEYNIPSTDWDSPAMANRIQNRYKKEKRFKAFGFAAIFLALSFLAILLGKIIYEGTPGFFQTYIEVDIHFNESILSPQNTSNTVEFADHIRQTNMLRLVQASMIKEFPEVTNSRDRRRLLRIFSTGVRDQLRGIILSNPSVIVTTQTIDLLASDDIDQIIKGNIDISTNEINRKVKDKEIVWFQKFQEKGKVSTQFHTQFFTNGDSRDPEFAGIWGAVVGSVLTLLVTLSLAFPIGVLSAIYLEEFAPKNRLTDFIEININNLAAVPSIVFGLLGLAVFLSVMGLPRSAPLVGGMTLALMTLPTIIISSRAAIKAVPPSIRDAARGLGASPMQVVFHHVMPLALPGILTGTIIGMAQALGETAPLLMVGMVAFIVDIPNSVTDAATVLPVQIFLWADSPERAFVEKTSAAIFILLIFLIFMNALAIWLRQKFERNW